jgi:hypothetical protein
MCRIAFCAIPLQDKPEPVNASERSSSFEAQLVAEAIAAAQANRVAQVSYDADRDGMRIGERATFISRLLLNSFS